MSNKEKIVINSRDYIRHTLNREYDKAYLASKPFLKPMPRLKYQQYSDNFYKELMEIFFHEKSNYSGH